MQKTSQTYKTLFWVFIPVLVLICIALILIFTQRSRSYQDRIPNIDSIDDMDLLEDLWLEAPGGSMVEQTIEERMGEITMATLESGDKSIEELIDIKENLPDTLLLIRGLVSAEIEDQMRAEFSNVKDDFEILTTWSMYSFVDNDLESMVEDRMEEMINTSTNIEMLQDIRNKDYHFLQTQATERLKDIDSSYEQYRNIEALRGAWMDTEAGSMAEQVIERRITDLVYEYSNVQQLKYWLEAWGDSEWFASLLNERLEMLGE